MAKDLSSRRHTYQIKKKKKEIKTVVDIIFKAYFIALIIVSNKTVIFDICTKIRYFMYILCIIQLMHGIFLNPF